MEIANLITHVEALIFASEKPLTALEITELVNSAFGFMDDKVVIDQVETSIEGVKEKYNSAFFPFELRESGGGWQFLTKREYHQTIAQLNGDKFLKRLSTAALETLAIIAYRQPVTRGEIEEVRGVVVSSNVMRQLEDRGWVEVVGHKDTIGRPGLYATTKQFLDDLSLKDLQSLPMLEDGSISAEALGQAVIEFDADATVETVIPLESPSNPEHDDKS